MSSSSDHSSESVTLLRRKMVRPPVEKSNFSQTCSLLSNYLKEKKGSFGDLLSMGVSAASSNLQQPKEKPETTCHQPLTTMNLLPNLELSSEASSLSEGKVAANRDIQSKDLFPQHASFAHHHHPSSSVPEEVPKTANYGLPATSPMTIFYDGKVLVFNNFPTEKAREIMLLASNGSSQKLNRTTSTSSVNDLLNHQATFATTPSSNQECFQLPPRPNVADLPIARKASLHRFLEKRKDRISAKAPYLLVNNSLAAKSSKKEADHSKMWLGLMASDALISKQFELQL